MKNGSCGTRLCKAQDNGLSLEDTLSIMSLVLWQKDVNFPTHVLFPLHQPLLLVFGMALKIFGKLGSHTDAAQHTARTEQFAYVQPHKTLLVSILFSWFPGYYSLKGGILPWET